MPIPSTSIALARFGPFEVDFRAGELLKNGRRIRLQDQPLQVLAMLLEHPGNVVTRDEFRQKLWPNDTFVDFDHGLNNAINRLRDALNDSAETARFIETMPRRGYRFIGQVDNGATATTHMVSSASSDAAPPSGAALEADASVEVSLLAKPQRRIEKFWLAAASVGIAAALILWLYLGRERRSGTSASMRIQSIAVLPLENLLGDPTQEYLVDGMTDGLTTSLAQMRGIRVISRTSAMRYKGTKKALPEIAKELNVDAVVEGSMSRSDGLIHVNAQLIHAADDRHLWAHSYSASTEKISNLQVEIAAGVAREIGTASSPEAVARFSRSHSVNAEAYDLYLRAETYHGVETREANDEAVRLLERSIVIDPEFAAAYAELASAYRVRSFSVEPEKREEWLEKARVAVQRALSLDPNLAEAYLSRGHLLWSSANNWAHERAVDDYRHALSLDPNLAEAHHQLANVYNHVGLLDKAESEIARAVELDPLNVGARFRVGINLLYQGKYEDSLAAIRDSEKFNPTLWAFQTAFALQHLRRLDEAQRRINTLLTVEPEDRGGSLTAMQALLAADAGDAYRAEVKIREALQKGNGFQHFHHVAYAVGSSYALLNRADQALRYLQIAADDGFPCYPLFEHDSNLDNVRKNPQFFSFMTEQKKQWEYFRAHM